MCESSPRGRNGRHALRVRRNPTRVTIATTSGQSREGDRDRLGVDKEVGARLKLALGLGARYCGNLTPSTTEQRAPSVVVLTPRHGQNASDPARRASPGPPKWGSAIGASATNQAAAYIDRLRILGISEGPEQ